LLLKGVRIDFEKQLTYGTGTLYASMKGAFAIIIFDKFHSMMGHPHNAVLKETSQANKIQFTGTLHRPCTHCTDCTDAKIRMKIIPKEARTIVTKKGGRLLIDLSWLETASFAHNRYWLLIMDENTHFLWSYFLKSKDEQVQVIIKHLIDIANE
jgi:hypothetical protein